MRKRFNKYLIVIGVIALSAISFLIESHDEEQQLTEARSSFNELYEDRLLAEHLIYQITELLHEKEMAAAGTTSLAPQQHAAMSRRLRELVGRFAATKLSAHEAVVFEQMKSTLESSDAYGKPGGVNNKNLQRYAEALDLLNRLSDIQLSEGKKLKEQCNVALASSMVGLKFQSVVFFAVIACVLVLLRHTWVERAVMPQHQLN